MSAKPGMGDGDPPRETEDFERKADAIRADLDRTLNALERKLSPRQLLDRSLDFVQANGGEALQQIGATVNKHPLPLLLASAGLIYVMTARRSASRRRYERGSSVTPRSGDFDPTSQSFSSSMQEKTRGLKQRAQRTLDATRARATHTWDVTRERTRGVGQDLNGLIREQPLVCGAIAVAVGAIIGAAFPASAYERDLAARARQAGSDLLDEMSSKAEPEPLAGTSVPPTAH
jgi:ElaB/YqjD/DUF883 family membrane-anchored ribosome-binding protein